MGCTVKEKHFRSNRKPRSAKSETDHCCLFDKTAISKSILESAFAKPMSHHHIGSDEPTQNPNSSPNPRASCDESGWGYCTEEQLEEILLRNLENLYKEAIAKLVGLGYDEEVAIKAILRNGHCYDGMVASSDILHNSLAYLNSSCCGGSGNSDEPELVFSDLRQLEEYSLARMVCLLQQVKPQLSKGDAMWCLLMNDLHVGRASSMEIPVMPSPGNGGGTAARTVESDVSNSNQAVGVVTPGHCRFHSGWGFGSGGGCESPVHGFISYGGELSLKTEIECPKGFNLSSSMKTLLKRNVALFAAGFRLKQLEAQAEANADSSAAEVDAEKREESKTIKDKEVVNSILSKFRDLNLCEGGEMVTEDQKDEMIIGLVHQINEFDKQVKERQDWAQEKAMQAARKLTSDLTELKLLRMEREETQRVKKGKQTLEDSTMKRLSEMENSLRKASSQVDRANAAVKRLETENAEIRAEMEASKLSAAESVTTCLELAKKEKKFLKRLLAWERQKAKMQEEIDDEKQKISELQQTLARIKQRQKHYEAKWKQEVTAKELAMEKVEEERRLKEAAEANNKRKLEALRLKIEIDFQRHKDDLQRLEQELSRLKASPQFTELHPLNTAPLGNVEGTKPGGETIAKLLRELDNLNISSEKEGNHNRQCMLCSKDEVSVVFLPCAHQVVCYSCSDDLEKKGKATCPCCRVLIKQKIRVFGASS
ncbi:hypothetical protein UlMin_001080 [Ulmus minor]